MGNKFSEYYKRKDVTSTYESQREGSDYRKHKRYIELGVILEFLDKKPKDKLLEIGCSSGFLTKHLGKVTAIDTSGGMIKIARRRNPEATIFLSDMFKLPSPFWEKSFDKVVTMRVFTHLDEKDLRKMLKNIKKVLKPKGIIIFDRELFSPLRTFVHFFYGRIFKIKGYKVYRYREEKIRKIIDEEGFDLIDTDYVKGRVGKQMFFKARKK